MRIEFELPDEIAEALQSTDLSRTALEAVALEGYRSRRLGDGQLRRLLGFETRMEVHAFLKEHGVYLNYSMEDLEKDLAHSEEFAKEFRERNKISA